MSVLFSHNKHSVLAAQSMAESNSPAGSFPPPPPPLVPMVMDGSDRDSVLGTSQFLSRQEVLERRSRRAKQLARIYKDHYWALMEELKGKYREYYWTYGKSPFVEDEKAQGGSAGDCAEGMEENGKLGLGFGGGNDIRRCDVSGCKAKAMALTRYCHGHILSDPKQRLYKGCNFVIKSVQSGPIVCSKPVVRSSIPCYCPSHLQKGEKCLVRDLRKAGLNVSSSSKLCPDLHVVIAEFVHQIQAKRIAAKKMG